MLRNYLPQTGFNRQLTATVTIAILALALLTSLVNSFQANSLMNSFMVEQGLRLAETLARQSPLAVVVHSPENIGESVNNILSFPDVRQVEIEDVNHNVLVSRAKGVKNAGSPPAAPLFQHHSRTPLQAATVEWEDSDHWIFGAPVTTDPRAGSPFEYVEPKPQTIGYVHVVMGRGSLNHLVAHLLVGNLTVSLSIAAALLLLLRLLVTNMLRSLGMLSYLMGRAEAGDTGMRVPADVGGPRDIIEMSNAFNKMMNVLEERENELKFSRDEALRLAQMKTQFVTTVTHEIRTPLNGVVGMLDILRNTGMSPYQRQCLEVGWESAKTLMKLINDILDFSNVEAGKLDLEEEEFEVRALMCEVVDLLAAQTAQKGIAIEQSCAVTVPDVVVGDAQKIRQVLLNLVGNAVKFTESGTVRIRVSTVPGTEFGLYVEVEDTGIGMPEGKLRHIFDSFTRGESSIPRKHGDTGLGLAISRQLVELMNGQIGAHSAVGQGSVFWFTVSVYPVATIGTVDLHREPPIDESPASRTYPEPAQPPAFAGTRILVVEDVPTLQQVVCTMLEAHGCICDIASSGYEALALATERYYDLILMDCVMADMDGYEVAVRIRSHEEMSGRHTPIIAFTAMTQADEIQRYLSAGMDDSLPKPVTLEALGRILRRWVPHGINEGKQVTEIPS